MKRPVATLALAAFFFAVAPLTAEDPPHLEFVRGLRDKHYFDLASEYLNKQIPKAPADQKATLVLELARIKLAMAAGEPAIDKRLAQYREAREEFEKFLKEYATSALASEAKLDLAGVALEQGKTQLNVALRQQTPAARTSELLKARALLEDAGKQLAPTAKQLEEEFKEKSKEEPKNDAERAERKRVELASLQAQYDLGLNYFDIGKTYGEEAADAKKRAEIYEQAKTLLESVAKGNDRYPISWKAHAWLGRCEQETGFTKEPYRRYQNLLDKKEKEADAGKRLAYYFLMLLIKEAPAVAKDPNGEGIKAGEEWLRRYGSSANSPEGYGVRYELGGLYLVQWGAAKSPAAKSAALNKALAQYKALEQTESEYADLAREAKINIIFQRIDPGKVKTPIELLPTFDDSYVRAQYEFVLMNKEAEKLEGAALEENRKLHYKNVIAALQQALKLAGRATGPAKPADSELNAVKTLLAYTYLATGKYDEARKTGEELGLAKVPTSQGAKAAMYALEAYDGLEYEKTKLEKSESLTKAESDRLEELKLLEKENRVVKLAEHMEKAWPNDAAGNMARHKLGLALLRKDDYVKGIEKLSQIKPDYPLYIQSQYQLAAAAREAEKRNMRPPAGQRPFPELELAALQSMPNPTPDANAHTVQLYLYGKAHLANSLLQGRKYKEVIQLVESLEARLANLKGVEETTRDELKLSLAVLRQYANLGLAEAAYHAGKYAEVIALLAPVVEKVKAGEVAEFKKNPKLRLALFGLLLRSYVQDSKPDKAQEILKLLLSSADGEGDPLADTDSTKALFSFAQSLRDQIDRLRKQGAGAKAQLDKTIANFAAFLDVLAKQDNLSTEYIMFLAQSYAGLGMHEKTGDFLEKKLIEPKVEPGKEVEQQKQVQLYRGGRILLVRELRLSRKFKEAKAVLDDIEKQPWGKGIQIQKEKLFLLEDEEIYTGQNGAILQWNSMMHQLRPKIAQNPDAKELYYEAYYHMIYSYYKNALKMPDPAKKKQYIQKAAGYIHGLETDRPDMGGDGSRRRFDDLLHSEEGKLLKAELDVLRKGEKPPVQAAPGR